MKKQIILLNGPAYSGKTRLAAALQEQIEEKPEERYEIVSLDIARITGADDAAAEAKALEERILKAADTAPGLIVEHMITDRAVYDRLLELLQPYDENRKKREKTRIYEFEKHADMNYRGHFSYRSLKILGWICIILSQVVVVMNLGMQADPSLARSYQIPASVFSSVAGMAIPLFLIANFGRILNASESMTAQLSRYGLSMAGIIAVSLLVFHGSVSWKGLGFVLDASAANSVWSALGVGQSVILLFVAPLVVLYSYTRTHKNKLIDLMIPSSGSPWSSSCTWRGCTSCSCR